MSPLVKRYPRNKPRSLVKILLACKCTVRTRDIPRMKSQKFLCNSGAGHGYKGHAWVSWEFEGQISENTPEE